MDLKKKSKQDLISHIRELQGQLKKQKVNNKEITDKQIRNVINKHLPHGYYETDINGKLIYVNNKALKLFQYSRNDIKKGLNLFSLVHPDDLKKANNSIKNLLKGKNGEIHELRFQTKGGKTIPVLLSSKLVKVGDSQRFRGIIMDIQERKKFIDEIIDSKKLEITGKLAGGIAHDFNNIFTGILGYASLLASFEEDPEKKSYLEEIIKSSNLASTLTEKLLAFGKKGKYFQQPTNLNQIIKNVQSILKFKLAKDIEIKLDLTKKLPSIDGDQMQLETMIMNLCMNGIEAMEEEGILKISTKIRKISTKEAKKIIHGEKGTFVSVLIEDQGEGIPKSVKPHIFEPFFTTKTQKTNRGTGLGLPIVKSIVNNHHGFLKVESKLGEGTKIFLYFPRGSTNLQEEKVMKRSSAGKSERKIIEQISKKKILIIDDEQSVRSSLKKILETYDHNILTATNGREGLQRVKENPGIDLILLDLVMPGLNGEKTFQKIKEINQKVKVIIITGYTDNEKLQELLDMGIDDVLLKPFEMSDILETISQIF